MNIRGIDTLIAVLSDRAVRLDRDCGELSALALDSRTSTALAVSALLKAHEKPLKRGARVLVLSSEFFTQTVRLPSLQTEGLAERELLSALVFEIEPFSNIPQTQSQAAFTAGEEIAGIRLWNVLQIAKTEIQAIQSAVASVGGKVIGLAFADNAKLAALTDAELAKQLSETAGAAFLEPARIPLIRPEGKGLGIKSQELIACLAMGLVCLACVGHFALTKRHLSALNAELRRLEDASSANGQIEAANAAARARIAATEKARQDRETAEKSFANYRLGWQTLMRGLLDSCDGSVVIQQIEGDGFFDAKIGGLSTSEKGPGEFLARLNTRIGGAGWRIQSEQMQTLLSLGNHGPVRFTFRARMELPDGARRPAPPTDLSE